MSILFLNWMDIRNPQAGGAELIIYELARRLVHDGHDVTWFCRKFPDAKDEEMIDGIRVIRMGNKYSVYFHAWRYYRALKQKPDKVVDCINTICWQTPLYVPKDNRTAYVNQLAREVFFYELPKPIGTLGYFGEDIQYALYRNTPFLCYSESVKNDIRSLGIPEKNIQTFPLGIDHRRYSTSRKSHLPLFVFIGRLVRMKRADLCISAMRHVVKKYPKAELVIIGRGLQEEMLRKQIAANRLSNSVRLITDAHRFLDPRGQSAKVKWMQKAWALLLPSVKEGWGMVVTEAAACGTPAIVSNVTGLSDAVIDGKTGSILSAKPTALELAEEMITYIENAKKRQTYSVAARKRSLTFTWEKSYTKFCSALFTPYHAR